MLVQTLLDTESSRVCLDWKRLKKNENWKIYPKKFTNHDLSQTSFIKTFNTPFSL